MKGGENVMNRQTDGREQLKRSPVLTGLSFLHATQMFAPFLILPYALTEMDASALNRQYFLTAGLLIPVVLSWLAIRYCRAFWLYVLSGAAAAALAVFLVREPIFPALTVFFWAVRGSVRIKKGRMLKEYRELPAGGDQMAVPELSEIPMFLDEPHPVHLLLPVFCYLISLALGNHGPYRFLFALLCAELPVCFAFRWLAGFYEYVEAHQAVASLPVRTMKKSICLLLLPALLVLLLVMLPAVLYGEEPLMQIRFASEQQSQTELTDLPSGGNPAGAENIFDELAGEQTWELPRWVRFLMKASAWCILFAFAAFVIRGIFLGLRSVSRSFLGEEEDEITFLGTEDPAEKLSARKKERRIRLFLTPEERIRKKFRKAARTAAGREKRALHGTETPADLAEYMKDARMFAYADGAEELRRLYEKARYSRETCTREEAEQAEKIR